MTFPPELRLLADCCLLAWGQPVEDLPFRLRAVSGSALAALARRHGVEAPVWRALKSHELLLPGTAGLAMIDARRRTEAERLAGECGRIHHALAASSLPHLFPGGPVLSQLAWGEAGLSDAPAALLVAPPSLPRAATLLSALGYVQEEPDPSVDPADWHRRAWRSRWRSDDGLLLDLLVRLTDSPSLLPRVGAGAAPLMVEVGRVSLPTLPLAQQLLVRAVEGSACGWGRLGPLATFAGLARRLGTAGLAEAGREATRLELERPLAASLLLSRELFGTPLPPELWFDGGARRLVRIAIRRLSHPEARRRGVGLAEALLKPGSRYFLSTLLRQLGAALIR
jgi:hypothetical protein